MDEYTENQRFNINMDHLILGIIKANEKLYNMGICETHPRVTHVALIVISEYITMENLIDNHNIWDEIINGNTDTILKGIQYFERKYAIKLSLFREIFFRNNTELFKIRDQLYENLKCLITISSIFISRMRDPVVGDDIIIYTKEYKQEINVEKYL